MSKLIKGASILTLATIICKVLGVLYVVPFVRLVGTQGNILFEYGFKPYALILSVATLGVPMAISKLVAEFNHTHQVQKIENVFRTGLFATTATGFVSCALLFAFASPLSHLLVSSSDHSGNSPSDIVFVIRMASLALLLVPPMSVSRGYFQGFGFSAPTAISQVIEQLVRVVFILLSAMLAHHLRVQVGLATFGSFVGACFGGLFLWYGYRLWKKEKMTATGHFDVSLIKPLFLYSVPFTVISLGIPLYQLIETFTLNHALMMHGFAQAEAEQANSLISLAQKLILIPVAPATAFGLMLVPAITSAYVTRDKKALRKHIRSVIRAILRITLPITLVMMIGAKLIFMIMYGISSWILLPYAPTLVLYSLFIVFSAILQGMNRDKVAVFALLLGVGFKCVTNVMLVAHWGPNGTIVSTDIGLLLTIVWEGYEIKKRLEQSSL